MPKQKVQITLLTIQRIRNMRGYSTFRMAQDMGISEIEYQNIESGIVPITLDHIFAIADILSVDIISLLRPDMTSFF